MIMTKKLTSIITITLLLLLTLFSCDGLTPNPGKEPSSSESAAIIAAARAIQASSPTTSTYPYESAYVSANNSTSFINGWTIDGNILCEWYDDGSRTANGNFSIKVANSSTNPYNGSYEISTSSNGDILIKKNGIEDPTIKDTIEYYIFEVYNQLESGDSAISGWEKFESTHIYTGNVACTAKIEIEDNYEKGLFKSETVKLTADVRHNGNTIKTVINVSGTPLSDGRVSFYSTYDSISFNGVALNPGLAPEEALAIINDIIIPD